jgi:hypothetical protein
MIKKYKWKTGMPNEYVHIMGKTAGGEFTLCGDSFDIDEADEGVDHLTGGLIETKDKIDCPDCVAIIMLCKSVKKYELDKITVDNLI